MTGKTAKSNGRADSEAESKQSELWWVLEWLVQEKGQRRTAEILGVNRKTVALALRREHLTSRMINAIEVFMADLTDPSGEKVFPLDQIESRIELLSETVEELFDTVEGLVQRVEVLEEAYAYGQAPLPAEAETETEADAVARVHENEAKETDGQTLTTPETEPIGEENGRRFGWWRR